MFKNRQVPRYHLILMVLFSFAALRMAMPPPIDMFANTGAPGEETCHSCHSNFPLNAPGGYLRIQTTPPFVNHTYLPGQQYLVTETFTRPPLRTYDCSTEIVDSLGHNAGTMVATDPATSLQTAHSGRICLWASYFDEDTLIHCNFTWTAPLSGRVSIYAAGVANENVIGGAGGYVSTDSLVNLQPGTITDVPDIQILRTEFYPNPVKNTLYIRIGEEKSLHYTIFGINAQPVRMGSTYNGAIDISALPAGVYWLQCSGAARKTQPAPFVKQ